MVPIAPLQGRDLKGLIDQQRTRRCGQQKHQGCDHFVRIGFMDDSMAHPHQALAGLELPSWKATLSWVCAILIALIFLVSGLWKITDAPGAAVRMAQARVPQSLSLAGAIGFGIAETF